MGIDFNDAEGIEPELLEQAQKGEAMMKNTAATDGESLKISGGGGGGGGGGGNLPFDDVIQQSQNNLTKVKQIISQGGFTGPEKDKYTLSLHHAEWVHARNIEHKCDNEVKEKSVQYTALVNGKAQTHEINKAHTEWKTTRDKCKNSSSELLEKANQYIETDRRVRANKKAESEYYPSFSNKEKFEVRRSSDDNDIDNDVEGFTGTNILKEGFDFYNGSNYDGGNSVVVAASGTTPAIMKYNVRLPRYTDTSRDTTASETTTILPWKEYYTDCALITGDLAAHNKCIAANKTKDNYIETINNQFERADKLLNIYYNISLKGAYRGNQNYLSDADIKAILENQKKNISLYKQNALYDYDEYNSLAFYEDLVMFLYYAVFAIFVLMSLREFFSSTGAYDKRNLIILILLGIYPKYILPVVLWILNGLTKLTEMLGLKNIRFWSSSTE